MRWANTALAALAALYIGTQPAIVEAKETDKKTWQTPQQNTPPVASSTGGDDPKEQPKKDFPKKKAKPIRQPVKFTGRAEIEVGTGLHAENLNILTIGDKHQFELLNLNRLTYNNENVNALALVIPSYCQKTDYGTFCVGAEVDAIMGTKPIVGIMGQYRIGGKAGILKGNIALLAGANLKTDNLSQDTFHNNIGFTSLTTLNGCVQVGNNLELCLRYQAPISYNDQTLKVGHRPRLMFGSKTHKAVLGANISQKKDFSSKDSTLDTKLDWAGLGYQIKY